MAVALGVYVILHPGWQEGVFLVYDKYARFLGRLLFLATQVWIWHNSSEIGGIIPILNKCSWERSLVPPLLFEVLSDFPPLLYTAVRNW